MKKKIKIKILSPLLKKKKILLPDYATSGSAGLDLRVCIEKEIILKPNKTNLLKTGFAIYIEDRNLAGIIIPRSGIGHNNGIILGNSVGLIDSDYQGELMISILNRSDEIFIVKPGLRIAQIFFVPIVQAKFDIVENFNASDRGGFGFGHSGY